MVTTVVVIEDHELVGAALRASLDAEDDLEVTGDASTFTAGAELVGRVRPDVAVVDLRIGDETALDHIDDLHRSSPSTRVLVLTGWATQQSLLAALDAGVRGYLTKSQPLDQLTESIRRVHRGETVVAPDLMSGLVRRASADAPDELTRREVEVLQLLAEGRSTTEIAASLFLSVHTVRNHVASLMAKLGTHTRVEAVSEGIRRHLISPSAPPGG